MAPPPGAAMPPPIPAYSGGAFPPLVPGVNVIASSGGMRQFLLVVPTDLSPDEQLPVVFMWHWLGGDANAFLERGDVQNAVDQMRFLAVIPEEKGDLQTNWPYTLLDSQARLDEELGFFDDLLACAADSYPIVPHCVASVGVSSGALFTGQLASGRGAYLSSFLSLSGGTGGVIKPWNGSSHVMPALVLWGGPTDACGPLNFEDASHDLENGLGGGGHFIVECVHNCGHSTPPFDMIPDTTLFMPLWRFVLDHPYWLDDGVSPWITDGLHDGLPEWCAIGPGSATIRVGACGGSEC
jgi:predicted esterase